MLITPQELGSTLFPHELQHIVDALRRDMRAEEARISSDPRWADVHKQNARNNLSLLQLLNPKEPRQLKFHFELLNPLKIVSESQVAKCENNPK